MRDRPEPVTMATIARMAGVTQPTVSRAFNHPARLSPETLDRIMQAVRQTGYVPNIVAGGLASSRSRVLAAIVPSVVNITYVALIRTFSAIMRQRGYQVMLMESGFDATEEERLVALSLAHRPEGILLTGIQHSEQCRRMLVASGIPVVEVWDLTRSPVDVCVGFSHEGAARAAARHMLSRGYRHFATAAVDDARAIRRNLAFAQELRANGHACRMGRDLPGLPSIRSGRAAFARLIEDGLPIGQSAIFCSSDVMAQGVMIEARARSIEIPREVAVMGFGDQDHAADLDPPLTTIRIDRDALGQRAAEALIARIDRQDVPERRIDIGFTIVERNSL
ncbi:LacI family DNA-binding transcriptional regulator [Cereibacter sp. SYSU M97828]|nr:LacI family DNA-binding transcriptional regulator [Cereibacter flavus]